MILQFTRKFIDMYQIYAQVIKYIPVNKFMKKCPHAQISDKIPLLRFEFIQLSERGRWGWATSYNVCRDFVQTTGSSKRVHVPQLFRHSSASGVLSQCITCTRKPNWQPTVLWEISIDIAFKKLWTGKRVSFTRFRYYVSVDILKLLFSDQLFCGFTLVNALPCPR